MNLDAEARPPDQYIAKAVDGVVGVGVDPMLCSCRRLLSTLATLVLLLLRFVTVDLSNISNFGWPEKSFELLHMIQGCQYHCSYLIVTISNSYVFR